MKEEEILQEDYEAWISSRVTKLLVRELKTKKQDILEKYDKCSDLDAFNVNQGASRMISEVIMYIERKMAEEVA